MRLLVSIVAMGWRGLRLAGFRLLLRVCDVMSMRGGCVRLVAVRLLGIVRMPVSLFVGSLPAMAVTVLLMAVSGVM